MPPFIRVAIFRNYYPRQAFCVPECNQLAGGGFHLSSDLLQDQRHSAVNQTAQAGLAIGDYGISLFAPDQCRGNCEQRRVSRARPVHSQDGAGPSRGCPALNDRPCALTAIRRTA